MSVRVRFAPSPTGNVHIGNIRVAIYNWLFARHEAGRFLLRIEDTDRTRSTPQAIRNLLDVMDWLGLDCDEEPVYQSGRVERHVAAAEKLLANGHACKSTQDEEGRQAILFRIPWDCAGLANVQTLGDVDVSVHPEIPVCVDRKGLNFAQVSKKGKPVPAAACLAGFQGLEIYNENERCLFRIEDHLDDIVGAGESFVLEHAKRLHFTRRQVVFSDLIRGDLGKPLDSMKDFVIVRSDGSPVFHLANVCDDAAQEVTHIVRGDDHVENTYRHIFLHHALGIPVPQYAHLPMIVNAQGKPYSKRDGDAFVGDFRDKGFLPQALLNYLALLGWSPGDDREKLSRDELCQLFTLDRVQRASAQMDVRKLTNLNGRYMAELPFATFLDGCRAFLECCAWWQDAADGQTLRDVAALMQSRTKRFIDVQDWDYFFVDIPAYDEKAVRKFLCKEGIPEALADVSDALPRAVFEPAALETLVETVTERHGIKRGKLNQPLRVAVTGRTTGAGIFETMAVIGRERVLKRLEHAQTLAAEGRQDAPEESG